MKSKILGWLAVGLLAGPMAAQAAAFQLSWQNGGGSLVTATFDGTLSGDNVTGTISGLSNISVFVNGVAFNGNGSLFASCYGGVGWATGCGVVSYNPLMNNFMFIDSNYPIATAYTNYFYSVQTRFFHDTVVWRPYTGTALGANSYSQGYAGGFSLSQTSVPEPGTLALLGLGLAGLGLSRRRKAN